MNYYDILEVSHTASPEVIQNAYKTLAKKYHPDVFQGDKSFAEEQMKQINEAYEVLSDPQKRMEYDRRIKDDPNSNPDSEETAKDNSSNVVDEKKSEHPKVKQKRKKPFWALSWVFICFLMFLSIMFEWKWMFWISLALGCGRFIINKKEPAYKTRGLVRIISIGVVGFMIFSCYVMHYDDTPVTQTSESSTSVSQHEDSDTKNNNFDSLDITEAPNITDLPDTTASARNLLGTFTQVGLYDHEAYTHLNSEYIPTIYLYDDNTFEFHCNFYEGMTVYKGSWQVSEDLGGAEYHFMVENEPSLPNLDFYINYNKSRCDADFLTDYTLDAPFGMTSVEDILFHPDIAGTEAQTNISESSETPINLQTPTTDTVPSDTQTSDELTISDIAQADFEDISSYAEEYDIKLYHTRKIRNIIQDSLKLWENMSEDNTSYVCRENKLFAEKYWTKTLHSYNAEAYYIGKLKDNKPSGVGILIENENVIYIGEFEDGRYNGIGILMSYATNHIDYCGEFKNGMYHGEGQSITYIIDESGAKLNGIMAGDYKESCLDGKYKVYYDGWLYLDAELDAYGTGYMEMYFPKSDQLQYKGQMKKQQYHGRGTLYDENGDVIYSGNWKNGDCD